jgi:hypothetical protein
MNNDSNQDYVLKDHGFFMDIPDFYRKALNPRNRKTLFTGLGIQLGYSSANNQIAQVRVSGKVR